MKHLSNMRRLSHELTAEPWALHDPVVEQLLEVDPAAFLTQAEIQARTAAAEQRQQPRGNGSIAILPLYGLITRRLNFFSLYFGGSSIVGFTAAFRQLLGDPNISGIVLDVDSPGGSVYGLDELAAEIYASRGRKPIEAVATGLMASAAYYISSACDRVIASPSSEVGSIGTVFVHQEVSKLNAEIGITTTLIRAPERKAEVNEFEPLTDDALKGLQSRVNAYTSMFQRAVARSRGAKVDEVRDGFGQGMIVGAKDAVSQRLADDVGTLDDVVAKMARSAAGGIRASETQPPIAARQRSTWELRAALELSTL